MAKMITIYQVTDNSDPAMYDSYFPNLKLAEEYAKEECDQPIGPDAHEIEMTKEGIIKALTNIPWR